MLDITTEQIVSHLTVLGWWPVMIKTGGRAGSILGICNGRQYFYVRYGRVDDGVVSSWNAPREVEWWRLRDDTLRQLVATVDCQAIGGWSGD